MNITDEELDILYEKFKEDWFDHGDEIIEQLRGQG